MVGKLKTVAGGTIEARAMLLKATESLASAEADLAAERLNSAVSAAVRTGIQACDAVCLALGQRRSADQEHARAVDLLIEIGGSSPEVRQKAKQLLMLLAEKNAADYSSRRPSRADAERAVKRAAAFQGWCSVANAFRFGGQYLDAESGLLYQRARYYDSLAAQFVSRDPLARATRMVYGYAADSPLNKTDPTGLITAGICGGIAAQLVWAFFVQSCLVIGFDTRDHHFSFAATQTFPDFGHLGMPEALGTPAVSASLTGQLSDAQDVSDLAGKFAYAGASSPYAWASGEYFQTPGGCGVHGIQGGISLGGPWPEIHGGISETLVERGVVWASHMATFS